MKYLIELGQVIGVYDPSTGEPPMNLLVVDSTVEEIDVSKLYFDGNTVSVRPSKPDPEAIWDTGTNEWIVPQPAIEPTLVNPWVILERQLRGSSAWAHAFQTAMQSVPAQAAFTVLLVALTSSHNIEDLVFAFTTVRQIMQSDPNLEDFSEAQLDEIRDVLTMVEIDPALFGL